MTAEDGRRQFLRRLSGEAVTTAGRLASLSTVLQRSVVAASEAATRGLMAPEGDAVVPAGAGSPPLVPSSVQSAGVAAAAAGQRPGEPAASAGPASSARPASAEPATVPTLNEDQAALLERLHLATLAVNDVAGAPHVTVGWFHWDGNVFRLPVKFFSARATNLARDARVTLFLHDPQTGEAVTVSGEGQLVAAGVYTDFVPLLAKYRAGEDPVAVWAELNRDGEQILVVVRPRRFLWHRL